MGLYSGSTQQKVVPLNHLKVTDSLRGLAIPMIFGQNRTQGHLIWYGDFTAIKAKSQGGKGLFGKGATSYVYTASIQAMLCSGAIQGVAGVWDTSGKFVVKSVTETYTVGGSNQYTVANASNFAFDQGVGRADSYSYATNDYGNPAGPVTLSGTYNSSLNGVPSSPAQGEYTVNPATGTYTFSAADTSKVMSITYVLYYNNIVTVESDLIPVSGPYHFTVQNAGTFQSDQGVTFQPSGTALTVGSGPGQYTQSGGTYTFNSANAGQLVNVTYEYTNPNPDVNAPSQLNLTVFTGTPGQSVWSYLSSNHPANAIGYTGVAYVASQGLYLGASGELPNFNYEVQGLFPFGAGFPDANPANVIQYILTDGLNGIGYPAAALDLNTLLNNTNSASNWWAANSFFISPVLQNQSATAGVISPWLEALQVATYISEGSLKFKPYGDTSVAGNGTAYIANNAPILELNDQDFSPGSATDPISVSRSVYLDAYNRVQIIFSNRSNDYNDEPVFDQDDGSVARLAATGNGSGLRQEAPTTYNFLTTYNPAAIAANLRLKRYTGIRNTYQFTLKPTLSFLEPMDLVTILDTKLGFGNNGVQYPIRIVKIEDDPKGLKITGEDYPWGNATPTLYPRDTTIGYQPVYSQDQPSDTSVLIFETPDGTSSYVGNLLSIFCNGSNPSWAGCQGWVSFDGTNYEQFGTIATPARVGVLAANLATYGGTNPDTIHTLKVNMSQSGAVLGSTTSAGAAAGVTRAALYNESTAAIEFLSYETATLTGSNQYSLTTLYRGLYGTAPAAWTAGPAILFARLDEDTFQYKYDPSYYGKTIFFKFPSFNLGGKQLQSLADATTVSFVLQGKGPGAIDAATGIYRPGLSAIPQSFVEALSFSENTHTITIHGTITVSRGGMPAVGTDTNQTPQVFTVNQTITGLTAGHTYLFYPYLDETIVPYTNQLPQFVNSTQAPGATGTPAIAYDTSTTTLAQRTYAIGYASRNDRYPLFESPIQVTTTTTGGTTGTGGGSGFGCPAIDMRVHEFLDVRDVKPGDLLDVLKGDFEMEAERVAVQDIDFGNAYCVSLKTENGCELTVSTDTPVPTKESILQVEISEAGDVATVFPIYAKHLQVGNHVITDIGNGPEYSKLTDVDFVGVKQVARIYCGGRNFAAGADPHKRIYSHNLRIVSK